MAVWQCASRFPPPRPAGSWALSRPLRQTLAPITPLHCPPALDARMRSSALRHSGTQVLRYSGTQVLRYSGTQVLRKAEQNHARPPRVLHSNLDLFPLPLGEGQVRGNHSTSLASARKQQGLQSVNSAALVSWMRFNGCWLRQRRPLTTSRCFHLTMKFQTAFIAKN